MGQSEVGDQSEYSTKRALHAPEQRSLFENPWKYQTPMILVGPWYSPSQMIVHHSPVCPAAFLFLQTFVNQILTPSPEKLMRPVPSHSPQLSQDSIRISYRYFIVLCFFPQILQSLDVKLWPSWIKLMDMYLLVRSLNLCSISLRLHSYCSVRFWWSLMKLRSRFHVGSLKCLHPYITAKQSPRTGGRMSQLIGYYPQSSLHSQRQRFCYFWPFLNFLKHFARHAAPRAGHFSSEHPDNGRAKALFLLARFLPLPPPLTPPPPPPPRWAKTIETRKTRVSIFLIIYYPKFYLSSIQGVLSVTEATNNSDAQKNKQPDDVQDCPGGHRERNIHGRV